MFQRSVTLEPGYQRRGSTLQVTDHRRLAPLRAARLCAEHGLKLVPSSVTGLRQIDPSPPLESRDDLSALLLAPEAAHGVHVLSQLGWLERLMPELDACKTVEPFGFHHLNVLEHSIEALRVLCELFPGASLETRLATLLHDVGKPAARIWDEVRQRWSFFGHDDRGAELAGVILERFGFPAEIRTRVALLIARHMIRLPADDTAAARFVRRQHSLLPDLLEVMLADREAARGASSSEEARRAYQVGFDRVLAAMKAQEAVKPLLTGDEVMALLNLEPGRDVGQALRFVRQLQEAGEIETAGQARDALLQWAAVRQSKPATDF